MSVFFNKSNAFIKKGKIDDSAISMNDRVISSHGTPVNIKDVVNKTYCDNNTSTVTPISTFVLVDLLWNEILPVRAGDISISVFSLVTNGPCGSFHLTKNSSTRHPSIIRTSSISGTTSNERLEIKWEPNTGIKIRKNGIGYNGEYKLKYLLNN